jgi:hypothetical protein
MTPWPQKTGNIASGYVSFRARWHGTEVAKARCMSTTHKAAKVSEPRTTTTRASRSVSGIIRLDTGLVGHSGDGSKPRSEIGKKPRQPDSDESTWGWVRRHRFDPNFGYGLFDDE